MALKTSFEAYALVALDIGCDHLLTYGLSARQKACAYPGARVRVKVRGHLRLGTLVSIESSTQFDNVLPVEEIDTASFNLPNDLFELARWMSSYYATSLKRVLSLMTPSHVKEEKQAQTANFITRAKPKHEIAQIAADLRTKSPAKAKILDVMLGVKKGLFAKELLEKVHVSKGALDALISMGALKATPIDIDKSPLDTAEFFKTLPKKLNTEQQSAFDKITSSIQDQSFEVHLIHGVTGSGKTEVYLQAIDKVLALGKSAIMLVPEVALTHQMIERLQSRFAGNMAALHSRLSMGERLDQWKKIREGKARVIIGPRSAIFSPCEHLGLIIIDEEHDSSYKEGQKMPSFHARDVAIMRAKINSATAVLGSATPALESFFNAKLGKYKLSFLTKRAAANHLPDVHIVDMRREFEKAKGYALFSDLFLSKLKEKVSQGEQAVIFLNRRGYHTTLLCLSCGEIAKCPSCDVALTFYKGKNSLSCHLCGFFSALYNKCPSCKHLHPFQFKGIGTELVEKSLKALFPEMKTLRMDADTTQRKGSHEAILKQFKTGKADVLIGTQMIAKGMDIPSVTLACILSADMGLQLPDFRASETAFQLIAQLAGRSGRGALKGEVVLQTSMPTNSTILSASKEDYLGFYESELEVRKLFGFPPFSRIIKVLFKGKDSLKTLGAAEKAFKKVQLLLPQSYTLHPLVPAGYAKIKDIFRYQFLIRGKSALEASRLLEGPLSQMPHGVEAHIDVDPLTLF